MFLGFGHLLRLARAGYILAREGVFAGLDPELLPPPARLPVRLANLIARRDVARRRPEGAGARLLADRPDLCEARAIPGDAARCRRRRNRQCADRLAGPHGALRARGGGRDRRKGAGQEDRRGVFILRRAGRGGLGGAGAYRLRPLPRGRTQGRGEGAAARRRTPIRARSRGYVCDRANRRALFLGRAAAARHRSRRHARPHGETGDGFSAGGGGGLGVSRKCRQ